MKLNNKISKKEIVRFMLGVAVIVTSVWLLCFHNNQTFENITITPGPLHTTRAEVANVFAYELKTNGIDTQVVGTKNALENLLYLQTGKVTFSMASGALNLGQYNHIREVTPLYNEALHILVKSEYAESVRKSLANLRNHTVNLGVKESAGALLAESVLAYVGLSPTGTKDKTSYYPVYQDPAETENLFKTANRSALPDAIIEFSSIPSKIAKNYIVLGDYQLVGIPFAGAYRLDEMFAIGDIGNQNTLSLNSRYTNDVIIPAYTYRTDPPVPSSPIHTIGAPLMLLSQDYVPASTVQAVLKCVFETRFARIMEPIISPTLLDLPPRLELHEGSINYRNRNRPLIEKDDIDELSSTLSAVGALVGGVLFLWQLYRQHRQASREKLVADIMRQIAELEQKVIDIELSDHVLVDDLVTLHRQLLNLKSKVLTDFNEGRLGNDIALMSILTPINVARDDVSKLLLKMRDAHEKKAIG